MPHRHLCFALLLLAFHVAPTASESLRRRGQPLPNNNTLLEEDDDTPFTIIFISDLENKYRYHDIRRSQYVIDYLLGLEEKNIAFDAPYSNTSIQPKMIIHGGDISHMWNCDNFEWFILGGCRNPQDDFKDVWDRVYKKGKIPMLSAFGNHDWRARNGTGNPWGSETDQPPDEDTDYINTWSNEFTQLSYQKSAKVTKGRLKWQEIPPTGEIGQSMYQATYGGIQIVNFNSAFNWESYDPDRPTVEGRLYNADEQFDRLSQTLDRSMKTIFFSHYPLNKGGDIGQQSPSRATAVSLIREFGDGVAHFAGHYHQSAVYQYNDAEPHFNDYVAPYPHTWFGREPGLLAILVSRTRGVLQVKKLLIPGLEYGEKCIPFNVLSVRDSIFFGFRPEKGTWFGHTREEEDPNARGYTEISDATRCCSSCKAGNYFWSASQFSFVCDRDGRDDAAEARDEGILNVPDDKTFRESD